MLDEEAIVSKKKRVLTPKPMIKDTVLLLIYVTKLTAINVYL